MATLTIVVAMAVNRVIGNKGQLPWQKMPSDMRRFKDLTTDGSVIMGRKTWDSIPERFKPLLGRKNIVLTSNENLVLPDVTVCTNIHQALEAIDGKTFVIGGQQIYKLALGLPQTKIICRTVIHRELEGDAFFPELGDEWRVAESRAISHDNGDQYPSHFEILKR